MKLKNFKGTINAYSDENDARKEDFLRSSLRFVQAIGRDLAAHGYTEARCHANRAGIAVSGEIYGEFHKPNQDVGIFVELGTTCLGCGFGARKQDDVILRAVWRCRTRNAMHTPEGPNRWLNVDEQSSVLAQKLLDIADEGVRQLSEIHAESTC